AAGGGLARRGGERARLRDRAHELRDALVGAAQLEDLVPDRAVLALELLRARWRRDVVVDLLHLAAEMRLRIGTRRADDGAMHAGHHRREAASGDADPLHDVGDRT